MKSVYTAIFRNTFLDFKRNAARTFLTSLGITVGVFAVVMLIAIGLGLKNFISSQFENLGANIIAIIPGEGPSGGFSALASTTRFHEDDVRVLERIGLVDYVAPGYVSNLKFESKTEEKIGTIIGTSENYAPLFGLELLGGQIFDASDVSSAAKVGFMGETLAKDLYGTPEDAVGEFVRFRNLRMKIKGVVKDTGIPERDNAFFIPYTSTFSSLNPKKEFFALYTGIEDSDNIELAKQEIEEKFLEKYDDDEFGVFEPSDILESLDQIFLILNGVLVAIGSISLLVGGIGIMNIMYANVTERTKEIGIRRAIGATKRDILVQFLSESTLLSMFGGVMGIIIATILVIVIRNFFPAEIEPYSVLLAVGISSFIGIFFGVFPARRAANLTPIEAIRD